MVEQACSLGILPCQRQRLLRDVGGDDTLERTLGQQGQRDRARPRADVQGHEAAGGATGVLQHESHELLGLGPRDERPGIRDELDLAKGGPPENVLQWLPPRSSLKSRLVCRQLLGRQRSIELEIELEPIHPQRVRQQVLRVQASGVDPLVRQVGRTPSDHAHDGPGISGRWDRRAGPAPAAGRPRSPRHVPAASRPSSSLARRSAATISSRSPWRISSRR